MKAADNVEPAPPQAASGKLLLTEEQRLERYKQKGTDSSRGGSSSGGRGKRHGKPRSRGSGSSSDAGGGSSSSRTGLDDVCKRCSKKGH